MVTRSRHLSQTVPRVSFSAAAPHASRCTPTIGKRTGRFCAAGQPSQCTFCRQQSRVHSTSLTLRSPSSVALVCCWCFSVPFFFVNLEHKQTTLPWCCSSFRHQSVVLKVTSHCSHLPLFLSAIPSVCVFDFVFFRHCECPPSSHTPSSVLHNQKPPNDAHPLPLHMPSSISSFTCIHSCPHQKKSKR